MLALGAKVFGERPYDEVRIDEIAERAGVSRALMYHYFPDKRAFFAAVVKAEGDRLFEATNTPPSWRARRCSSSCARVCWRICTTTSLHPHGAWAAYVGQGTSDPVLRGIEDTDNERQINRLMDRMNETLGGGLDSKVERDVRITMYGWLAMTMEMCRQRIMDPSIDAGQIADTCAHALLDMVGRVPGSRRLTEAIARRATRRPGYFEREAQRDMQLVGACWHDGM